MPTPRDRPGDRCVCDTCMGASWRAVAARETITGNELGAAAITQTTPNPHHRQEGTRTW